MLDPGKIQSHSSIPKDAKDPDDQININDLNSAPDLPPGYENYSQSKPILQIPVEDLSFPPGFDNFNITGSLPAKLSNKLIINNNNNIITKNNNEQLAVDDSQNVQPNIFLSDSISAQQNQQKKLLDNEPQQNLIPSFSNLVYNIESSESFRPQLKPDPSRYDKLTICSNLLSIQDFNLEKSQIEKMISAECQLCENKINKFINGIDQRNKKIENMFHDLSEKVGDCTTSNLCKKNCNLPIDDIVDTRNEFEIEKFLRDQKNDSILINASNEMNSKQMPKQETILNLLSILCRIYLRDKDLASLWVKYTLPWIDQITDIARLKPILLEIKRVMCPQKNPSNESNDISTLIDSKLC